MLLGFYVIGQITKKRFVDILVFVFGLFLTYLSVNYPAYIVIGQKVITTTLNSTSVQAVTTLTKEVVSHNEIIYLCGIGMALVSLMTLIYTEYKD